MPQGIERIAIAAKTSMEVYKSLPMTSDEALAESLLAAKLADRLDEVIKEFGRLRAQAYGEGNGERMPLAEAICGINNMLACASRHLFEIELAIDKKHNQTRRS